MNPKSIIIIELCLLAGLALWAIFTSTLFWGAYAARREFRAKGYVKPPKGRGWIRFLLGRQYEPFETPATRVLFRISHICLIGMFIAIGAIAILLGSEFCLRYVASGGPPRY